MKFTTDEVKALVIATMPAPMKDAAEEAFIDWLDQIVENVTQNVSQWEQPGGYEEGFEAGYDEGYEDAKFEVTR
jgi:flagellar biosynthesis/type III secretory pathway protein FliH